MKHIIILIFLFSFSILPQSAKTNLPTKSTPVVVTKEPSKEPKKEAPIPKDIYSAEDYSKIEKKIQTWSLEEIEAYAVANNPLYLAEKQNIGMARGDLITAALYRNPVGESIIKARATPKTG
jgi:cobalt-zinc-cadmium efflux system outer membrane protein